MQRITELRNTLSDSWETIHTWELRNDFAYAACGLQMAASLLCLGNIIAARIGPDDPTDLLKVLMGVCVLSGTQAAYALWHLQSVGSYVRAHVTEADARRQLGNID